MVQCAMSVLSGNSQGKVVTGVGTDSQATLSNGQTLFSGTDHWRLVDQDEVKRENSLLLKTGGRLAQGLTTVRKRE